MTAGLVQAAKTNYSFGGGSSSGTLTIDSGDGWVAPSPGSVIVLQAGMTSGGAITWPAGFTEIIGVGGTPGGLSSYNNMAVKTADGTETSLTITFGPVLYSALQAFELSGVTYVPGSIVANSTIATSLAFPSITPTAGTECYLLAGFVWTNAQGISTMPASYTFIDHEVGNSGSNSVRIGAWYRYVASASGAYTGTATALASVQIATFQMLFVVTAVPLVADFTAATSEAGTASEFTDTSTGTPTSWAWDFGDGSTSTSQDPPHVYAVSGTYSVTLTVTNASGSDTVTHSVTIVAASTPDPPTPAGVLLEIYASAPGSARWDVAKWDEAVWGEAGWRDVTPYGIDVDITWGSTSPDDGILTVPSAASWAVDYYDPTRILDPSNEDGPYFGDLVPGLPIRVSHRGVIVRVGSVTGISHSYVRPQSGYMRAADNITVLANAEVPSDTTLSDTLYARAQDAIEAAGLTVQVRAPIGTDPAVSPWVTGEREWSAWEWIKDAAQEVLHIPIIDKDGFLTFRPWALPLARGRGVSSPELIGLQVISDYSGLYSVVQATDATDTVIERALTPPPRYGARVFARTEHTLDAGDWAEAVLADRAFPILRWQPGEIYPLTALSVEQHATIEAVERISISFPEADPAIFVSGIVVGGDISIRGKRDAEAKWRFTFYTAQTVNEPLIETGGDPTDYLLRTGGGEYLYPTT